MKGKKLTVSREENGLNINIDGNKVFYYEITKSAGITFGNRWSIAYERFDDEGRMHHAYTGYPNLLESYTGPDDPLLPKVKNTIFRSRNRDYLIEITFSGKISIKNVGLVPGYSNCYNWKVNI